MLANEINKHVEEIKYLHCIYAQLLNTDEEEKGKDQRCLKNTFLSLFQSAFNIYKIQMQAFANLLSAPEVNAENLVNHLVPRIANITLTIYSYLWRE